MAPPLRAMIVTAVGLGAGLLAVALPAATPKPSDPAAVRFGRDIQPLLAGRCFKCHGPDDRTRAAGGLTR